MLLEKFRPIGCALATYLGIFGLNYKEIYLYALLILADSVLI